MTQERWTDPRASREANQRSHLCRAGGDTRRYTRRDIHARESGTWDSHQRWACADRCVMLSLTHEAASTLSLRGDMRLSRREGSWVNLNRLKQPPASPSPLTLSLSQQRNPAPPPPPPPPPRAHVSLACAAQPVVLVAALYAVGVGALVVWVRLRHHPWSPRPAAAPASPVPPNPRPRNPSSRSTALVAPLAPMDEVDEGAWPACAALMARWRVRLHEEAWAGEIEIAVREGN